MSKQLYHPLVLLSCLFLFLGACSPMNNQRAFNSRHHSEPVVSQELASRMKNEIAAMEEVEEVHAVSSDNNVYMFLKVSGVDRFFLKRIRKDAYDRAKAMDDNATVHISTDSKIAIELTELESKLYDGSLNKKQLEKELQKVENDMKG
ncbi:Sporulation lipoprotein YhcN/YlaJ (Spore_YhcN_YlaJ) [Evansella caseinilytica]|uniref:Sporulation lipoprotein YhcN/YlaJ (Spore_YhcN_YlaJ) n=1 Tax=Evansella caseinilytica TaxID=1503961 RepID=A0A1H3L867_9BACI|nr:YhcN/YlaJ family sporulation lipoprotein [Evansella caseinilytica]SDY60520.1 Sporulation lipoprotein YhcN/YlaJ (Spore_YhcN_YlaJ) [Evansella caseinilytica]